MNKITRLIIAACFLGFVLTGMNLTEGATPKKNNSSTPVKKATRKETLERDSPQKQKLSTQKVVIPGNPSIAARVEYKDPVKPCLGFPAQNQSKKFKTNLRSK